MVNSFDFDNRNANDREVVGGRDEAGLAGSENE